MSPFQSITETLILHLKEGVNLENAASDPSSSSSNCSPASQVFVQLTDILKSQQGFIRQFWGHQFENPNIFVWSIDWESFEYNTAFINSKQHNSFMASIGQIFDLEVAAPLRMYTRFTSETTAALIAPVTEVAFFTVPNGVRDNAKTIIENDVIESTHPVITVGKSSGGAMGWVFDTRDAGNAVSEGESIALHGIFGYTSVDDLIRWRETPECAQVLIDMAHSPMGNLRLGNPNLPGGNIFVPDSSMFHVKFRAGV